MSVAVLDLGSNSFTMLVAEVWPNGTIEELLREREPVQLGALVGGERHIDREGWRRAMIAIAGLVGHARMRGATRVVAVATGVLRDADNGPELVKAAGRELGIEIAILAPDQAARLAYLGVRSELPALFGRLAVIDVGGGSIEIAVGEAEASLFDCSLPLGIQRLRQMVERDGYDAMADAIGGALATAIRAVRGFHPQRVVLASGTARAVHKLVRKRRSVGVGPEWMDRAALRRVASWARDASPNALREAGVRPERLATIPISAMVFDRIAELAGVSELHVSRRGLREGVLLDEIRQSPPLLSLVRPELPVEL